MRASMHRLMAPMSDEHRGCHHHPDQILTRFLKVTVTSGGSAAAKRRSMLRDATDCERYRQVGRLGFHEMRGNALSECYVT